MSSVPIVLLGFGHVGQAILKLLGEYDGFAAEGARLALHSVFDSRGGVVLGPLEGSRLLDAKLRGGSVTGVAGAQCIELDEALARAAPGILVDCSTTDADSGEPGFDAARRALERGMSVVFASKGPLVAHFEELSRIARRRGARIGVSAAVGVPLPTLEVGTLGLRGAGLRRFRAVLNDTSNQLLRDLEAGLSLEESIELARSAGTIEADSRLDIDGWDATYKLLILARILWRPDLHLDDVETIGVGAVRTTQLSQARSRGRRIRLIATGERAQDATLRLTVRPESLEADDPLFSLGPGEKGCIFETESMGTLAIRSSQGGPLTTAACVIKDVLNLTVAPGI